MGTELQNQRNVLCGKVSPVLPLPGGTSRPTLTFGVIPVGWTLLHVAAWDSPSAPLSVPFLSVQSHLRWMSQEVWSGEELTKDSSIGREGREGSVLG